MRPPKNKRTPIQSAALTILSLNRLRVYTVQTGRLLLCVTSRHCLHSNLQTSQRLASELL